MKKRGEITAFYVETLLMIVVMIGILLVLTQVLGLSKGESMKARRLTEAVTIAQSAAEILAGEEELSAEGATGRLLRDMQTAQDGLHLIGYCDWNGSSEDPGTVYRVEVTRTRVSEAVAEDEITVFTEAGDAPLYTLTVRQFRPGKEAA